MPKPWPARLSNAENLPPLAPGHVRLYRSILVKEGAQREFDEVGTAKESDRWFELSQIPKEKRSVEELKELLDLVPRLRNTGRKFYTDDLATALSRVKDTNFVIAYVDVPDDMAMRWYSSNNTTMGALKPVTGEAPNMVGGTFNIPTNFHAGRARLLPGQGVVRPKKA